MFCGATGPDRMASTWARVSALAASLPQNICSVSFPHDPPLRRQPTDHRHPGRTGPAHRLHLAGAPPSPGAGADALGGGYGLVDGGRAPAAGVLGGDDGGWDVLCDLSGHGERGVAVGAGCMTDGLSMLHIWCKLYFNCMRPDPRDPPTLACLISGYA